MSDCVRSKIDGVGNKALTTVEWVRDAITTAVAPISKPDILRFIPEGYIKVFTESGRSRKESSNYWQKNNGIVRIHLDNLQNWAIKHDSSKTPGASSTYDGRYWIEVGLVKSWAPNFNAIQNFNYYKLITTSNNPTNYYNIRTDLNVNADRGGATTTETFLVVITDRIAGRSITYRVRFPAVSGSQTGRSEQTFELEDLEAMINYGNLPAG